MKKLNELMQEIILLTAKIETDYPELYRYLDETPLVILGNPPAKLAGFKFGMSTYF